ncbi:hypothetical protein [Fodinicola feengrottensis]|uniref:Uncharacterized protein n=1 Tax=Fodinicola feengrottensis TaxID=435914 RepID=A0ABN2H674_9ACTN|nr:hypothetical protein [Fodinicola feengrottensis]
MTKRSLKGVVVGAMAAAAILGAAAPAAAATHEPASPQTFKYVQSFFSYTSCESYGYNHYNGYNNTWFCTNASSPDTLPWSLFHEDTA